MASVTYHFVGVNPDRQQAEGTLRTVRLTHGQVHHFVLKGGRVRVTRLDAPDRRNLERLMMQLEDAGCAMRKSSRRGNRCHVTADARELLRKTLLSAGRGKKRRRRALYKIDDGAAVLQDADGVEAYDRKLESAERSARRVRPFVLPPDHRAAPKDPGGTAAAFGLKAAAKIPEDEVLGLYSDRGFVHAGGELFEDLSYMSRYEVDVLGDVTLVGSLPNFLLLMNCSKEDETKANCVFEVYVDVADGEALEVVAFAVATRRIKKGSEILTQYGDASYWSVVRDLEGPCARAVALIDAKISECRGAPQRLHTLHFAKGPSDETHESRMERLSELVRRARAFRDSLF